jgi:acyl-CoA reductase-like NAD-dependent aldehyde dehydrogenase
MGAWEEETVAALAAARRAQASWRSLPVEERLGVVRRLRGRLAGRALGLADRVTLPQRRGPAETLSAEVLPLLDACRFLERDAARVLAPRRLGRRRRPLWLAGSWVELRREPRGVVLVIGPANYPLLLPGVQAIQALVAGNAVLVKPAPESSGPLRMVADELAAAGLPEGLLQLLGEEVERASAAIAAGVDLVVLTGSHETGRTVLAELAERVTPAVMELSGCDPVLVCGDADLDLAAEALRFGLTLNGSFTCIAPRRVFVDASRAAGLEERLRSRLAGAAERPLPNGVASRVVALAGEAIAAGARVVAGALPSGEAMAPLVLAEVPAGCAILNADLPAPVLMLQPVAGDEEALRRAAEGPYRLGATVFGRGAGARRLAEQVAAGVVVVNDLIAPTGDPRVPFGGSGASGFGVTRGAEGLLEMTVTRAIIERRGRLRPHLDPPRAGDERLFAAFAAAFHAPTVGARLRAAVEVARLGAERRRQGPARTAYETGRTG